MKPSLTIKEFGELLASAEESALLEALRKLATIQKAEEVVAAIVEHKQLW
jgi:hypothetical protein